MSEVLVKPHTGIVTITDFSADVDLVALNPRNGPARNIFIVDAGGGVLALRFSDGTSVTFAAVAAGIFEPRNTWITTILAATDITELRVAW